MEAEIEGIFENGTEYSRPLHAHIHNVLGTVFCIVGILCDILIIYIFAKSRRMQTRTNLMILNWAVFDALFLFTTPYLLGKMLDIFDDFSITVYYFFYNTELLLQTGAFLFMFFLYANFIIKSKKINTAIFIRVVHGIILLTFVIITGLLIFGIYKTHIYHLLSVVVIMFIMIALICKDISRCVRWCRKKRISQSTCFRLNVARIYVYGYIINTIFYFTILPYRLEKAIFYFTGNLCSLYIAIYLIVVNRSFKLSVLNILKCKYGEYDVDAMIALSDECSDDEENSADVTFNNGNVTIEKGGGESV